MFSAKQSRHPSRTHERGHQYHQRHLQSRSDRSGQPYPPQAWPCKVSSCSGAAPQECGWPRRIPAPAKPRRGTSRCRIMSVSRPGPNERVLAKVAADGAPRMERHEPSEAWIIDDTGSPGQGSHLAGMQRPSATPSRLIDAAFGSDSRLRSGITAMGADTWPAPSQKQSLECNASRRSRCNLRRCKIPESTLPRRSPRCARISDTVGKAGKDRPCRKDLAPTELFGNLLAMPENETGGGRHIS